jgi:hypothetical protein
MSGERSMFKAIFGFVGILVVLAVVGSLMKNQLGALGMIGQATTRVHGPSPAGTGASPGEVGGMAGRAVGGARLDGFAATAGAEMPSAQAQIQGVQQSVRDRTAAALQQGVQRSQRAQP